MHDVVVLALTAPIQIGVYQDGTLIRTYISDEQSSEALPKLFSEVMDTYGIRTLAYVNGPGSFMAIKITYLFLKTVSIVKNLPLLAVDAFYFNGNRPFKAVGKLCFVKNASAITTERFEELPDSSFRLPSTIDMNDFSADALPFYGIGAVG